MTGIIAAVKGGLEILAKLPLKEGLGATASWLLKGSPIVLRILILVCAAIFALFGTAMWRNISAANQIMMNALGSPLQEMSHPDTAIEALLLTTIVKQQIVPVPSSTATSPVSQAPPKFSSDFGSQLKSLEVVMQKAIEQDSQSAHRTPVHLDLVTDTSDSNLSQKIFSDTHDGFLFVPGSLLSLGTKTDGDKGLTISFDSERRLYRDIIVSQSAAAVFCTTFHARYLINNQGRIALFETASSVISSPYLQSYLIFSSGVTRICESSSDSGWKPQRDYYEVRFPASTHLERRPYFQPTVDTKNGTETYWTPPYFDLGGNGLIQTVCRYFSVESSDAILCFDFQLKSDITSEIRSLVGEFGGTVTEFECEAVTCTERKPARTGPSWNELFSTLYPKTDLTDSEIDTIKTKYANSARNRTESELTGGISIVTSEPDKGLIVVLVPRGENKLLAVKLDLTSYQWWRSFWIIIVAGAGAATLLLSVLVLADYGLKVKEQERAFTAVDTIMTDVPAPYARVDEDDKFLKINDAFAKLMGFTSVDAALAELRKHVFGDFLAEGKDTYQGIKQERIEGKPYRSYIVCLWAGGGPGKEPRAWVKIHGGDVPTPHAARKRIGQSFGILLRTDAPGPVAVRGITEESEITEKRA